MSVKLYSWIFISIFFLEGCSVKKNYSNTENPLYEKQREQEYYKLFTDATKIALIDALFTNSLRAVPFFEECIKMYPGRGAPYFQISSLYARTHDVNRACMYAVKAYERDTTNEWYILNLANLYQFNNKIDSAAFMLSKLLLFKNDDGLRYNLATMYEASGRYQMALDVLSGVDETNRNSKEIILLKHDLYNNLKEIDSAVVELNLLTRILPDDISNYGILAEYLTEIGRMNYAREVYKEILKKDVNNGLSLLSFGEYYLKNDDKDSAFYYYDKAFCNSDLTDNEKLNVIINFVSNNDFLRNNIEEIFGLLNCVRKENAYFSYYAAYADLYISLENYRDAKSYLDSALIYEKGNYLLWEQSLLINSYINNDSDVVKISNECLQYFSDKPNVYMIKAYSLQGLNLIDSAINNALKVIDLNQGKRLDIQANSLLGELYRNKGLYKESDECFDKVILEDPGNLIVRNNYAYYLALRGEKLEKAEEMSKLTVDTEPNNATYLDTYGWVLFKSGKFKEALKYIESAIRNGAYENVEVLEHYGDIMIKLDRCTDALEAYERINSIDSTERILEKLEKTRNHCK
jgi:tetratricopeptide (TPR) repeat protein